MNMKTNKYIVILLAACLLGGSCSRFVRDELVQMQNEMDALWEKVNTMNGTLGSLKEIVDEMASGGYIVSATPATPDEEGRSGYLLTFNDGSMITLYSGVDGEDGQNGQDGHSPAISLKQDEDGAWYWTLDGEWMLGPSGEKIKAVGKDGEDGVAPRVKVEDGYWWVATGGDDTWQQMARAKGEDAVDILSAIDVSQPDHVVLTLADGRTIAIPRYQPLVLKLSFPDEENGISAGETYPIGYELEGDVTEKTVVTAGTDGRYLTRIERISDREGTVWVTCPAEYTDGYIYFIVNDGKGGSQIRVVTFYERKMTLPEGLVFPVDAAGATVTVPYSVNFAFEPVFADGCDSWIHLLSTRAETVEGNLSFQVDANTAEEERFGFIEIHPVNHPEYVHTRIAVRQAAATAPEQGE